MAVLNVSVWEQLILLLWKLAPSLSLAIKSCAETLVKVDNNFAFLSIRQSPRNQKLFKAIFCKENEIRKKSSFQANTISLFACLAMNTCTYYEREVSFSVWYHSKKHINRFFLKLQNPNPGECHMWQTLFTLS